MAQTSPEPGSTRRGLIGSLLGGLGLAASSRSAQAAPRPPVYWSLRATPTSYTFGNGSNLPFYRLSHSSGGTTHGLIPLLEATEGETVILTLDNQLPIPIRPALIGVADGPLMRAGQMSQFSFTMPAAGSYLIGQAEAGRAGTGPIRAYDKRRPASGFSAIAISRPVSGANELWTGGPSFDREYFLLYEDADDRYNATMTPGLGMLPREAYEPNYFMLNGQGYPDTSTDPSTTIAGNLGERILIRMGNLGRMRQSIHFHGFHPEVVARNNAPETILADKDTVPLARKETLDVILTASQLGSYPIHPHSLTAVTANGSYPYGQLTLITIS